MSKIERNLLWVIVYVGLFYCPILNETSPRAAMGLFSITFISGARLFNDYMS